MRSGGTLLAECLDLGLLEAVEVVLEGVAEGVVEGVEELDG